MNAYAVLGILEKVNYSTDTMTKENVLLTGGNGFIGRHLLQWLKPAYGISRFERSEGYDMTNVRKVAEAMGHKTAVLHFAATAVGRRKMQEHPEAATIDFQVIQTISEAAVNAGAFLVYPSSTLISGDDAYGVLKKKSEALLASTPNLRYTILRLATVYGPGMPSDSVVSLFLQQALRGEPLTIFGPGTEQRYFTHVDDVCAAVEEVLEKKSLAEGHVFDVGMASSVSLNELAQLIVEITKSKSPLLHTAATPPPDQILDTRPIQDILGWKARLSLREGLLKMLDA